MPSFPEVSIPKIGDGFYTPEIPSYPKKILNKKNDTNNDPKNSESTITDSSTTTDLLTNYFSNINRLTASDITSLSDSGSFNDISSLLNTGNFSSQTSSNVSTNVLLQQILKNLDDLKTQKSIPEDNTDKTSFTSFKDHNPSILRFKINGYDIKDSLTTVFLSKPENDGTFLLTADRRYIADKKVRNETFYILFKTLESSGSVLTYEVCPSIVQDSKNENSFIYRLTSLKNLKAQKTGNLVVLRSDARDCVVDLLLDIDN
ncbi:MAG: hypothetical protein MJ182_10170 [Treponema sp.]|nr:hypothetical protein [Treponema sp.]